MTEVTLCSYAAPLTQNQLPHKIRNSSAFAAFKRNLRKHYFSCAFH